MWPVLLSGVLRVVRAATRERLQYEACCVLAFSRPSLTRTYTRSLVIPSMPAASSTRSQPRSGASQSRSSGVRPSQLVYRFTPNPVRRRARSPRRKALAALSVYAGTTAVKSRNSCSNTTAPLADQDTMSPGIVKPCHSSTVRYG
jgi:hypothetical protein